MDIEIVAFVLIHLFIGLVLPFMVYMGCCNGQTDHNEQHPDML